LQKAAHRNKPFDYIKAKGLRQRQPRAEALLWAALRALGQSNPIKFRRQHPLHPYIVDFVCLKEKLVIEIDGYSHDVRQKEDAKREAFLNQSGYTVLHFSNEAVYEDATAIAQTIRAYLDDRKNNRPTIPPCSSPLAGEAR